MADKTDRHRAVGELYRQYRVRVYRTALTVLKSPALAEEAAQEVWLRAVEYPGTAEDLRRQLPVMAKNAAIDLLRRESRSGPLPEDWEPPGGEDPAERAAFLALKEQLRALPAEYRDILELKHLWGRTNRDIARLLNISESTVATRAARGRERLRAALKKEGYDL